MGSIVVVRPYCDNLEHSLFFFSYAVYSWSKLKHDNGRAVASMHSEIFFSSFLSVELSRASVLQRIKVGARNYPWHSD